MAFAKIHEAIHVCSLVGEQKYVQCFVALENAEMHREEPPLLGFVDGKQLFDRLFLQAKKAEIETVRNRNAMNAACSRRIPIFMRRAIISAMFILFDA